MKLPSSSGEAEVLERVQGELESAWPRSLATWSDFLLLSPPELALDGPIAMIDLSTRQVVVNAAQVDAQGLHHCLEALLAHEVGHHMKFPATLAVQARLTVLGRTLWPDRFRDSLVNLFTDFLINRELEERYREAFCEVYRSGAGDSPSNPPFDFYLTMYECAWGLEMGTLTFARGPQLESRFPGAGAAAKSLVRALANTQGLFHQFIAFCGAIVRFVEPTAELSFVSACGGPGDPADGDWAEALEPSRDELAAIEQALGAKRIKAAEAEAARAPLRASALPTGCDAETVVELAYRKLAARQLVRPPASMKPGEERLLPSTLEAWSADDSVAEIDWTATALRGGVTLGELVKRERDSEEGVEAGTGRLSRIELYLDISGSMPSGRAELNAMTLSAVILAVSAIRSRAAVRSILWSDCRFVKEWCRSESAACRFLLSHSGGGTLFPFDELERSLSVHRDDQPFRVIISDAGFVENVRASSGRAGAAIRAARASGLAAVLCVDPSEDLHALGARTLRVPDVNDLPRAAALLARHLFERGPR
ncbi:MAG: hypothetical protein HYV07_31590 [Deltaproteobacteria bacterium]|nr:hypothetical protein [Deltaproteobacteria bacterium]